MKILCVLYDDPKNGMPSSYPLKELPKLEKYPDGMTLPSPKGRDFTPGELLGCVSGELCAQDARFREEAPEQAQCECEARCEWPHSCSFVFDAIWFREL